MISATKGLKSIRSASLSSGTLQLFLCVHQLVIARRRLVAPTARASLMAPIHRAAQMLDVAALQRELDAGVSPDLTDIGNVHEMESVVPLRRS